MSADIAIQFATRKPAVPRAAEIRRWVTAALRDCRHAQLTVRIVDANEGLTLNQQWRDGQGPTNVLSFPCDGLDAIAPELLGDIVICAPVVAQEAEAQQKPLRAHWAHMLVHGTLHLLGYEHDNDADAAVMEQLETDILDNLGYPDPYSATPATGDPALPVG